MKTYNKILDSDELIAKVSALRKAGKTVVQSHGIFDIIHPGVIRHLEAAGGQGDVLIVTVIRDKDVRRGPGRPIFPDALRAENVASLGMVDWVAVVDDDEPFACVRRIKPDIFARGQAFDARDPVAATKLTKHEQELSFGQTRIYESRGTGVSSTRIINKFLDIYPEETKNYLQHFAKRHTFADIKHRLDRLQDLKVLLIGDGIIDEYHYVNPLGKSAKAHLVVSKYLDHEVFAGGAFAIANHLSGICSEVHLVTLLGTHDSREEFIRGSLRPNVIPSFFYRDDGPTVVKKRYINQYLNQKLFEVNYLNDVFIDAAVERRIISFLQKTLPRYHLVLVSDFGHGFITRKMINVIQRLGRRVAVNTQTNAANTGFNMITKYRAPFFVCLDEMELRWAAQERFLDVEQVARTVARELEAQYLIITMGKQGSISVHKNKVQRTPIFSSKVIDTVGAGDAFFSFTAPCLAQGMPLDLVGFVGNAVGALAVQIMGNKKPVEKHELMEFIHSLLK